MDKKLEKFILLIITVFQHFYISEYFTNVFFMLYKMFITFKCLKFS